MKQTAVEWLQERISIGLTYEQEVLFEGLFDQAKEMEKEQMIKFYDDSVDYLNDLNLDGVYPYNETFKQQEQ
jgi:hypothetical protein